MRLKLLEIFSLIKKSLGVEFEYEKIETQSKLTDKKIIYSQVNLPKENIDKIKSALELYNVTQLDKNVTALQAKNEHEEAFVEKLKAYLHSFDMESMKKIWRV
jgi:hypothetical protein